MTKKIEFGRGNAEMWWMSTYYLNRLIMTGSITTQPFAIPGLFWIKLFE
jgi:hypothetical protein